MQTAHVHTQPEHTHNLHANQWANSGAGSITFFSGANRGSGGAQGYATSNGGDNTGSAQPSITVNTTNVTTSSATPSITIGSVGSGTAFDIIPPYYTVCVWKRLS